MITSLRRFTEAMAAITLMLMMAITVIDVVGRYFFHSPVASAYELTQLLMALLVFSALPMVTARENHIVVELLAPVLAATPRRRAAQRGFVYVVSIVAMAFIGLQVLWQARNLARAGDTTPSLSLPLFPFVYYMAILTFMTALALALVWYSYLSRGTNLFHRR